jgi:hypothetical protein
LRRHLPVVLVGLAALLGPAVSLAPASAAVTCSKPRFVTSNSNGMWSNGGYVVHNNMWNISGYSVSETLRACSYHNWNVRARASNSSGDGAVKTYPNVHKDFHNWNTGHEPRLSSFQRIRSPFAATTPHKGIYNAAYDIWLNGVADNGSTEVMIWTDNFHQVPAGSVVARGVKFSGHTWKVYATGGNDYIAWVPNRHVTHGTMHIKAMLHWLVLKHRVRLGSTVGQVCFGFEIVATGGARATFKVTRFAVHTIRR